MHLLAGNGPLLRAILVESLVAQPIAHVRKDSPQQIVVPSVGLDVEGIEELGRLGDDFIIRQVRIKEALEIRRVDFGRVALSWACRVSVDALLEELDLRCQVEAVRSHGVGLSELEFLAKFCDGGSDIYRHVLPQPYLDALTNK